ncbi:MAG: VWA domain-containing protein [Pyrinomonadaceae bacterium]
MKNFLNRLVVVALLSPRLTVSAQTPPVTQPSPPAAPQTTNPYDDDDVVRITTNLVQFDVTVTDKNGNPVSDLKPEDFEISENGQRQEISNFSYVAVAASSTNATPSKTTAKPDPLAPPIPLARLSSEAVRRTIALVVDDLGLSAESISQVQGALRKFVNQQVQPNDLVAVIRTSGGVGVSQQFTSDKRQLLAAIERIRWNPSGRGGISAIEPLRYDEPKPSTDPTDASNFEGNENDYVEQSYAVGTLGSINYVVRGLRELPGRKSIILLSDGFQLRDSKGNSNTRAIDHLDRLIDAANRASVVIYTMDARGVAITDLTAADDISGVGIRGARAIPMNRSRMLFDTQSGLIFLAKKTGGFNIHNNNDLGDGLKQMIADQNGYYLIGYHPDATSFDPQRLRFNNFRVKLKRSGLQVRYRSGFLGISDEKMKPAPPVTTNQKMEKVLMSPFNATDAQLQLTSLFGNDAETGSFLRSFLHIKTQDLTFTDQPDGSHQAVFDLMAITFRGDGVPVDQVGRTYTIQLKDDVYTRAMRSGFVYVTTLPVKRPGGYQYRVAIRDAATERTGSAGQFVEIPDLTKDRLQVSGIAAFGSDQASFNLMNDPSANFTDGPRPSDDPDAGITGRRFHSGMVLQYACYLFNARIDRATGQPQLKTQLKLFRDGKEVFAGHESAYDPAGRTDLKRLPFAGALQLGAALTPGQYVLQVVVTDSASGGKKRTASQWVDFEILP